MTRLAAGLFAPLTGVANKASDAFSSSFDRAIRLGSVGRALAQEAAPASENPAPPGSQEVVSQRTRDSKVFENPDGTFTAVFGHYLHYEASPGQWEDVDLNLRPDGSDYVMDRHDIVVRVSNNEVKATNRKTGKGIGFPIPSSPSVTGRRATFTAAGVSWSYYTTKTGLKLSATISSRIGQRTYSFPYRVLGSAGSLSVDGAGRLVGDGFVIPRPIIYGADREMYNGGSWRIQSGQIKFDYDDSSLPAAAFPYELDPTTTFTMTMGSDDGQVWKTGGTYPPTGQRG